MITVELQEVDDGSPPPETCIENRMETTPSTKSQPPPSSPSPSHTVMTGKGKHITLKYRKTRIGYKVNCFENVYSLVLFIPVNTKILTHF